ncbi:MAG TPA: flagellar basal body rod protein FlgC [Rhizomicrobium sp.]|nr:flagellar basal body rod protein FlgC [Rhizomicrobium sp.]
MDLKTSMLVAASGMRAQSTRMRVIAENIANANSTAQTPGGDPYRRKVATVKSDFDSALNATLVKPGKPVADMTDFSMRLDPGNPAADEKGYVKLPNVSSLIEVMDMREAQRSYEADISVMEASKSMLARTVDLLRR